MEISDFNVWQKSSLVSSISIRRKFLFYQENISKNYKALILLQLIHNVKLIVATITNWVSLHNVQQDFYSEFFKTYINFAQKKNEKYYDVTLNLR